MMECFTITYDKLKYLKKKKNKKKTYKNIQFGICLAHIKKSDFKWVLNVADEKADLC